MTATEIENMQEAFILANSFSIELVLGVILLIALFLALFWVFSIPKGVVRRD